VRRRINTPTHRTNFMLRLSSDAKVLRECAGTLDRGLVDALAGVEGVVPAVGGVIAAERPGFSGRENVPGFDDVVFDEGVACPAVEGEVAWAFWGVGAGVAYGPNVWVYDISFSVSTY
jgi:hypothetical protein